MHSLFKSRDNNAGRCLSPSPCNGLLAKVTLEIMLLKRNYIFGDRAPAILSRQDSSQWFPFHLSFFEVKISLQNLYNFSAKDSWVPWFLKTHLNGTMTFDDGKISARWFRTQEWCTFFLKIPWPKFSFKEITLLCIDSKVIKDKRTISTKKVFCPWSQLWTLLSF